jgi:glycosyltransferase involved in cell wall biosynthesis
MSSASPLRVLHVIACDALSGTELMVSNLILRSESVSVLHELAILQEPGPIAARMKTGSRDVESLGGKGGFLGASWRLARLLRSRRYDVVVGYGFKVSVVARVLVRLLQRRAAFVCGVRGFHVTDVEDAGSLKARTASLVERILSPLVDIYDANSHVALERLASLGIDSSRLVYIPNGIDLSQWSRGPGGVQNDGPPLIVCIARFNAHKRHQDLLEAFALLQRCGQSFQAVLAGTGPTLTEMRALAMSLGLNGTVELPGRIAPEAIRELLGRADIACLPSAGEGMPGALMEAMASEVAVVATNVDGTNELLVGGESGLLVPVYDPRALAHALASLLTDGDLRRRLAAAARIRIEDRFSLEVMVLQKERLFTELADRDAAR